MSTTHELEINLAKRMADGSIKRVGDLVIEFNNEADIWSVQAYNETLDDWFDVPLEKISESMMRSLMESAQEKLYQIQNERGAL